MLQKPHSSAAGQSVAGRRSVLFCASVGVAVAIFTTCGLKADSIIIQGSPAFYKSDTSGNVLDVTIKYAVYAPGSFSSIAALGTPEPLVYGNAAGPDGGGVTFTAAPSDYVYIYQIVNNEDSNVGIGLASIGYNPDLWNLSSPDSPISSVGQIKPSGNTVVVPASSANVLQPTASEPGDATEFYFAYNDVINRNESSYLLLISSPYSPVLIGNVFGSYIDGGGLGAGGALSGPSSNLPIPLNTGGNGAVTPVPLPKAWIEIVLSLSMVPLIRLMKRGLGKSIVHPVCRPGFNRRPFRSVSSPSVY